MMHGAFTACTARCTFACGHCIRCRSHSAGQNLHNEHGGDNRLVAGGLIGETRHAFTGSQRDGLECSGRFAPRGNCEAGGEVIGCDL